MKAFTMRSSPKVIEKLLTKGWIYLKNPDGTDVVYYSWALGYMSALNSMSLEGFFDLNAETTDDGKRFLREYCSAHPLANYMDGVFELMKSLPIVKRKDRPW